MNQNRFHRSQLPTPDEVAINMRRIEGLTKKIEEIDLQIQNLTQSRLQLAQERVYCQSFIAAFRRLPTEILCEIAKRCMEIGVKLSTLNRVSYQMREAINGSKSLWTTIRVLSKSRRLRAFETACQHPEYFRLVLERASPLLLDIEFHTLERIEEYMTILTPFSHIVSSLGIVQARASENPTIPTKLPNLKFTSIDCFRISGRSDKLVVFSKVLMDAIQSSSCTSLLISIAVPDRAVYSLLSHVAFRKAAQVEVILDSGDELIRSELGVFPQLEGLTIQSTPQLLSDLSLPNLISLDVEDMNLSVEEIPNTIQRLSLDTVAIMDSSSSSKLRWSFLNLVHMDLTNTVFVDSAIDIVVPLLARLSITGDRFAGLGDWTNAIGEFCLNGTLFGSNSLQDLRLALLQVTQDTSRHLETSTSLRRLQFNGCIFSNGVLQGLATSEDSSRLPYPRLEEVIIDEWRVDDETFMSGYGIEKFKLDFHKSRPLVKLTLKLVESSSTSDVDLVL